jgi:ABC-2 type transport system permease protein
MNFRAMWAIIRKDVMVWLHTPANISATLLPAVALLLVQALASAAVSRSPVALVVNDPGPQAQQIAASIQNADVFRLTTTDAAHAQTLLHNLDVVAVITIPSGFSQAAQSGQHATVDVLVNNLNLDFTNDIRRAVPDTITHYYQTQGDASPIKVTMQESDLRAQDIQIFQFTVLPTIVLLLMVAGLVSGGLATAREWEARTVKEVLLAPTTRAAIITGKVLAGFVTTFGLGVLVFLVTNLLGWIQPTGVYWLTSLLVIALVALLSASLGVAVGALMQRVQAVIAITINAALYLFFLAGGTGVLAFEPDWLQNIAAYDPLTYGTHALQQAVFYQSADQLGTDLLVLALSALVALALGTAAMRRGIAA